MREKIAEIICPDCQDKKEDGSCIWKNCSMYDKKQALEALFTAEQSKLKTKSDTRLELINRILEKMEQMQAETAAMRDIIGRLPNVSCCAWETLEENMGYGEGELQAKIDTALKGGKYGN